MTEPEIQSMLDGYYRLFAAVAKAHEIEETSTHPDTIRVAKEVFSESLIKQAHKLIFYMGAELGYDVASIPATDDWDWKDEREFEKFLDDN